jgi:glycosyltransferase involved in cell wall biosynthesis
VTWVGRPDDAAHRREQNRHTWHLCPSQYEGWGHSVHEALSCGAAVVTHDGAPLSEVHAAVRVPSKPAGMLRLAQLRAVSADDIAAAAERCWAMTDDELAAERVAARAAYEAERQAFADRLRALLDKVTA